jgi:hypothetical protein
VERPSIVWRPAGEPLITQALDYRAARRDR